jgi:hypothetical protein
MGDWKFLCMMVGRLGYSGGYCMYDSEQNGCHCGAEEWDMAKLDGVALQQLNNEADKEKYKSKGIIIFPCWEWLLLDQVLIPILHDLLGLGNDLVSSTKELLRRLWSP